MKPLTFITIGGIGFIVLSGCPEKFTDAFYKQNLSSPALIVISNNVDQSYTSVPDAGLVYVFNINPTVHPYQTLLPVGVHPTGLAVSPDGQTLYVMNQAGQNISIVTVAPHPPDDRVIGSITSTDFKNLGEGTISPDGTRLYVISDTTAISVISTASKTLVSTITDASITSPTHLLSDPLGRYIFVSEFLGDSVTVLSPTTTSVLRTIGVGMSPDGLAATNDGKWLFVVNSGSNSISVIDVGTLTVVRTMTDTSFSAPRRIVLTPGCGYGFVSEFATGNVSVVSQNTLTTGVGRPVVSDIVIGRQPYDMAIIPYSDHNYPSELFVTLRGENAVAILIYPDLNGGVGGCP